MEQFWNNAEAVIAIVLATLAGGIWIGKVQEHKTEVKKFMDEIRADVKKILDRLVPSPLAGASPLRLSDLGHSISAELDGKAWAARTAQKLKDQVEGMQPYEINEFSFAYMEDGFAPSEEQDARIRSCAYENALSRGKVLKVLAVELRDRLLELAGAPVPGADEAA